MAALRTASSSTTCGTRSGSLGARSPPDCCDRLVRDALVRGVLIDQEQRLAVASQDERAVQLREDA